MALSILLRERVAGEAHTGPSTSHHSSGERTDMLSRFSLDNFMFLPREQKGKFLPISPSTKDALGIGSCDVFAFCSLVTDVQAGHLSSFKSRFDGLIQTSELTPCNTYGDLRHSRAGDSKPERKKKNHRLYV